MKANRLACLALAALAAALGLEGCAGNPLKEAQTVQQKAYAIYGTFVIIEEQGAHLVQDPAVPQGVKSAIRSADAAASPLFDTGLDLALQIESIRQDVAAGKTTEDKLLIASANLDRWITEAVPKLAALAAAVRGAHL